LLGLEGKEIGIRTRAVFQVDQVEVVKIHGLVNSPAGNLVNPVIGIHAASPCVVYSLFAREGFQLNAVARADGDATICSQMTSCGQVK
jgi:hypothetical protein